jgi:hypothetical protein
MTTTTTNPQHDVPLPPESELVGQQQASQLTRKSDQAGVKPQLTDRHRRDSPSCAPGPSNRGCLAMPDFPACAASRPGPEH